MIVKDAADTLEACLQSVRPHVDELCIVDTGSTDRSPEIARRYADKWELFLEANNSDGLIEDFSRARNRSFDLITGDWAFWIDSDDVLVGGQHLRELCNAATDDNVLYLLPYEYSHDEQGNCTCIHFRERLVRPPHRFAWRGPVHEVLLPIEPIQGSIQTIRCEGLDLRVVHHRQHRKNPGEPGRNLRILKAHLAKVGENDPRSLYYAGLEYGYTGDLGNSIRLLRRYIELSQWHDEKCLAIIELARHYSTIGDHESAINWALKATAVRSWPEPYWRIGKSCYALAMHGHEAAYNFARAAHFLQLGLQLGDNDTVLFVDPRAKYQVHEFLNVCLSRLGNIDAAIQSCEMGLQGSDSEHLRNNLAIYRRQRAMTQVKAALEQCELTPAQRTIIEKTLDGTFQVELLEQPYPMPSQAAADCPPPLRSAGVSRVQASGKLDLVFLVGHQLEPWNPATVAKTGIGGSETMAMEMAKRLAQRGHLVRLYGHCTPTMEGVFDGVEYLDATKYHGVECDVMVSSRKPQAVDDEFGLKAKARVLWVHDVHVGEQLTMVRDIRFDLVLCLSEWHRRFFTSCYPRLNPAKVLVTRNGIDLSRFEGSEERNPHRVVYSSSPDRGLQALLELWPTIRQQVPDAELHVFYGFTNWETTARATGDQAALRLIAHLKHLAKTTSGVVFRDRVNQRELAREFMRSGVWAYPTWFNETSCCHPDTRISVPGDHRGGAPTVRIADMVGKSGFPVYAFNEAENRFQLATCKRVWETKVADELVAIELDNGETLRLTPDHRVLTFDGDWVDAGTLRPGDSLRALHYRYNVAIRDANGRWKDEHRLVGEWKEGRRLLRNEHVDHVDPQRLDNRPEALAVMTAAEHFSKTHKGKRLSRKHVEKKRLASMAAVAAMSPDRKRAWHAAGGRAKAERLKAMDPMERDVMWAGRAAKRKQTIAAKRALPLPYEQRDGHNHKVVSVSRIVGPISVYDMEVEGLHNFIADGVVVHNCITAMEAQAAGCRIVASDIAALRETVGSRGVLLQWGHPDREPHWAPTAGYRGEFIERTVMALTEAMFSTLSPGTRWSRDELTDYASEHFCLDKLADDWDVMLTGTLADVNERVLPAFHDEVAA